MVASNKELAKKLFFFILNSQSSLQELTNVIKQQMDIDVNTSRGWSMLTSSDSSGELLMHSNALSVSYADRVQALANCPTWAKQVEEVKLQSSSLTLFYATVRKELNDTTNMVPVVEVLDSHIVNMCTPQGQITLVILCSDKQSMVNNNTVTSQGLKPLVIPDTVNQFADPQL